MLGPSKRDELCAAATAKLAAGKFESTEYDIYPPLEKWSGERKRYDHYRRMVAYQLYSVMGVGRKDKKARADAMARNFVFFDGDPLPQGLTDSAVWQLL